MTSIIITEVNPISRIFNLLSKYGNGDYIGEKVTQIEHMIQGATLARNANEPKELIIAILVHDIGHLLIMDPTYNEGSKLTMMGDLGVFEHEKVGAEWLAKLGFNDMVCDLVFNHVNAKRYLVSSDPEYRSTLSDASLGTLNYQGGFMASIEIEKFKEHKNFSLRIKMRQYDDLAKLTNLKLPDLESFRELCQECIC